MLVYMETAEVVHVREGNGNENKYRPGAAAEAPRQSSFCCPLLKFENPLLLHFVACCCDVACNNHISRYSSFDRHSLAL
jgi:hypothetical protein